ncbi:MAG: protein translocase subunit SecF [Methylococcaceae bacterium]|nr:protein translocase subunit SecF [Methylococcaceae bacterium]MCI0734175.1 protein translocase subunit SecF [Methylococcaceae bacterium]
MNNLNIDFLGQRGITLAASFIFIAVSIGSLVINGLRFGIDFTGGTLIEVGYQQPVELSNIRDILRQANYGDAVVQHFGTSRDVLIRIPLKAGITSSGLSNQIMESLNAPGNIQGEKLRVEFVGPQVGDELAEDGGLAMLYAMFGILIYVAWRFEYKFALGSVAALIHDVLITIGYFSLFGLEFDLTVLAAILAVIGYSLNDTIVVYDRIRENFRRMRKGTVSEIMNTSLNQTLSRTMMTGVSTLMVLVALAVLGGETIHNFSLALIVGIIVGTYSSIYIASPIVLGLGLTQADLIAPEKEGDKIDQRP